MKAAIIGGGIGGLATAVALQRIGIDCTVYEQAAELREIGAGLTLWSNAVLALQKLGVSEPFWALGSNLDQFDVRRSDGKVLTHTDLGRLQHKLGIPENICVPRADLLRELARLVDPQRVYCDARCVKVQQDGRNVRAEFSNGSEFEGDFLIGADGLHSVVRNELHGNQEPRYAGYTCWRGLIDIPAQSNWPAIPIECWGRAARFAALPCGPGRVFWWAAQNIARNQTDGPNGRKADVTNLFERWHEPVPSIIAATPEAAMIRNDIVDRPPITSWGRGRITLLGDAAHPTTPNLGQGACQAIEDALVLADCLYRTTSVESALRDYELKRQPRTALVTNESWRVGKIGQLENPLACSLRDLSVQAFPAWASLAYMQRLLFYDLPNLPAARRAYTPRNSIRTLRAR